jgi:hypothetical protein
MGATPLYHVIFEATSHSMEGFVGPCEESQGARALTASATSILTFPPFPSHFFSDLRSRQTKPTTFN